MTKSTWILYAFLAILQLSCSFFPEKVSIRDQRLKPLLEAANSFDRAKYGFSPLPDTGRVYVEFEAKENYDAMIHFYGRTSRTIAFRKAATGFRWIGEQETFKGPREYTNEDGTFNEEICLTYDLEPIAGVPLNQLDVRYSGGDLHVGEEFGGSLKLERAIQILDQWGYRKPEQPR